LHLYIRSTNLIYRTLSIKTKPPTIGENAIRIKPNSLKFPFHGVTAGSYDLKRGRNREKDFFRFDFGKLHPDLILHSLKSESGPEK